MNDRTHYATGHVYIEGVPEKGREDCQILVLCHDPNPEYTTLSHHRTTCPDCLLLAGELASAHLARRLELDRWLQEQGAIRIQVRDLGAALEALRDCRLTHTEELALGSAAMFFWHSEPAHLARQALGLAEGS